MSDTFEKIQAVRYEHDKLIILDQTKLPMETMFTRLEKVEDVWDAIFHLKVRGAPAIGIAAAYGLYIAIRGSEAESFEGF